jgi:hypothetical protein
MQIFLYEWWPLMRRSRIYRSLSRAQVHVSQGKAESDFHAVARAAQAKRTTDPPS